MHFEPIADYINETKRDNMEKNNFLDELDHFLEASSMLKANMIKDLGQIRIGNQEYDKTATYRIFASKFALQDGQMSIDLIYAIGLFFQQAGKHSSDHHNEYMREDIFPVTTITFLYAKPMNCIMGAAFSGDPYAKELIKAIFRRYYKRDFNCLKKFTHISCDELYGIAEDSLDFDPELDYSLNPLAVKMAILVVMAEIMDIPLDGNFDVLFLYLENCWQNYNHSVDQELERIHDEDYIFDHDLMDECSDLYKSLLDGHFDKKTGKIDDHLSEVQNKWIDHLFQSGEMPSEIFYANSQSRKTFEMYAVQTLYCMKKSGKKVITFESMMKNIPFTMIIDQYCYDIRSYLDVSEMLMVIGNKAPEYLAKVTVEEQEDIVHEVKLSKKVAESTASLKEKNESLQAQIEELKAQLKAKESLLQKNRDLYESEKQVADLLRTKQATWEKDSKEKAILQEYVYAMDSELADATDITYEEMGEYLAKRKIAIVGGNENWIKKIKQIYPNWIYLPANVSGTLEDKAIQNIEKLYFFNKTMSHSSYEKYKEAAFRLDVPFGYIHVLNIESLTRYIYDNLQNGNKDWYQ